MSRQDPFGKRLVCPGDAEDLLDPADLPRLQADLDAVRVRGRFRQDVAHDSSRPPAGVLIGLLDDLHLEAGVDLLTPFSRHVVSPRERTAAAQHSTTPSIPDRRRLVAELPAGETFTASRVAQEVNRRFGRELRKPIDSRLASTALRRLLAEGAIALVQKGTAHREALYSRG
jgi:hypothetical protein